MTALSDGMALLFLFVILPVFLALAVAALVQWRSAPVPQELRTSDLLRDGAPGEATLLDWRTPGQSFLDRRPMVTFRLSLSGVDGAELFVTQSVTRAVLRSLERGMIVDVRLSPDRRAGAIVFPDD